MDMDHIPVRDTNIGGLEQRAAQQRRMASKWGRDELEDKYLRMSDENIILKKYARKQEDKIKRMATKLLRLVNDKKKTADFDVGVGGKRIRDVETEGKLDELHDKIRDLEKQNLQYKEKLSLAKQQLVSTNKRPTNYPYTQSRINTGIPKTAQDPRLTKNMRVSGPPVDNRTRGGAHSPTLRYGHSMLEETRTENQRLTHYSAQQQEQINMYELENKQMREQIRMKASEYEEDLAKIKHQITAEQRVSVQENIDLIKLQRDVKEKSTQLLMLQEKYSMLEENLRTMKRSHDTLLMEMENANLHLKEEQNRCMGLQNDLKLGSANQRRMVEMQEQVIDLQKEIGILKDANEKLVSSAFDLEREREWRQKENALRVQIAQLEATLKADLGEKGGIIDKLATEKDQYDKMASEHREMQLHHYELREKYDDLVEKMKFFTKESAVDFTEIEEALILVKQRKQKLAAQPDFLHRVDEELDKDEHRRLLELQAEYAEMVHELDKTRNMLVVQHKINKDYQQEVVLVTGRMDETKKEYEMKLDEYARLLDMRQARIKKLESQLRDVAYGTKQYKIHPPVEDTGEDTIQFDETIHLERGQNLFEIHVTKVSMSGEALRLIGDDEPSLFCTWEFFEYEIQSTPVLRGARPEFDFTSQYIVSVDDFFLHYLQKESCTLELHQSFGQDYNTIAACQLTFREIFDKTNGRIHGTASLTGVQGTHTGLGFGTVEYWIRLRVPMDQALRLYKERTKALGYVTANIRTTDQPLQAMDEMAAQRPPDNINELHVKITRCTGLRARRENVQPSPYCVYQFFDYNDHDTVIIHSSNNPEFNDHKTYPVPMTSDLDQYLKTMTLKIFVFDDTDPEQTAYIGIADIPLIPLCHDKGVQGIFELKGANGRVSGCVEVELGWQFTYMSPSAKPAAKTQQLEAAPREPPEKLVAFQEEGVRSKPHSRMAAKFGPSATSTPMPKPRDREEPKAQTAPRAIRQGQPGPSRRQLVEASSSETEEELIRPATVEHDSMVQAAVSHVVSNIMPTGLDTMTTLNDSTSQPGTSRDDLLDKTRPVSLTGEAPLGHSYLDEKEIAEEIESDRGSVRSRTSSRAGSVRSQASSHGSRRGSRRGYPLSPKPAPRMRKSLRWPAPLGHSYLDEKEIMDEIESDRGSVRSHASSRAGSVRSQASGHGSRRGSRRGSRESEQPLGETLKTTLRSDTMFGDAPSPESETESITEEIISQRSTLREDTFPPPTGTEGEESETPPIESDSEGLVVPPRPSRRGQKGRSKVGNSVTIAISHVSLMENCTAMTNESIRQLFVEYKFLGIDPPQTETPFSLPKPKPFHTIQFNFSKTFHVDLENNYARRQYLASMLLPSDPDNGRIRFTLVSEPPDEDQDVDCEDVGVAIVNIRDILRHRQDVTDQDIDIVDINDEERAIGSMNLTVQCLEALESVEKEMQVEGTY